MSNRPLPTARFAFARAAGLLALLGACNDPAPTPPVPSAAPDRTASPTTTASAAPTATASAAVEPTATASATAAAPSAIPDAGAKAATDGGKKPAPVKTATPDATAAPTASAASDAGAPTATADAGPPLDKPAAGSADAMAEAIDKIYVGQKTFSAKFSQEYTTKVTGIVKKSSGTVFVQKPDKISFRYDPPSKNRIVSDGTTLKVYVAEDSQMFVSPVDKSQYPGALAFIMGKGLRPSFSFRFEEKAKNDKGPVLEGKPRTASPYYEKVFFFVDKALLDKGDAGAIARVIVLDAQGNRNRFSFESARHPDSIDASEFMFEPPAGTDIKKQ
jgi:outer membrane lipoprotein carrier protein